MTNQTLCAYMCVYGGWSEGFPHVSHCMKMHAWGDVHVMTSTDNKAVMLP